jgi:PAS domain S-box-containing protein
MKEQEILLNELAERERLLGDQLMATRRAETLVSVMDALNDSADIEAGLIRVLEICCEATKADLAVLLKHDGKERMETFLASDPVFGLPVWSLPPSRMQRTYRVTDTGLTALFSNLPAQAGEKRSLLSVPVVVGEEAAMALIVMAGPRAHFSVDDQALLERVGGIIARAMQNWRLSERNAVLSAILEGAADLPQTTAGTDSAFEALSRAFDRLTDWQNRIVQINNALLCTPADTIDMAIDQTLADIGQLADSDRTYVFRLRAPERLDNTHEWVGPGIEPMIDKLQDLPDDLMDDWRADFETGRPVYIPDVDALPADSTTREILQMQGIRSLLAVPMSRDGVLTGFVGHDAVHRRRRFLPAEIRLLQSVSHTISVIMDRREAEADARRAEAELAQERDRLAATLAALPDLLLELDSDGRFVGCYFGGSLGPAFAPEAFLGQLAEDVLPPDLAANMRQMMQEVDANGICGGYEYPMRLHGEDRWFAASVGARRNVGGANGYIFLIRDVTESHQRERELRRLGEIAKLTSNLVVITDAQGRIEWVNPAFEGRSGWKSHEVIGQKPGDFLQFEKTDRTTVQRIAQALKRGEAVQAELLNRSRAGTEYWVSKDIQPLIDGNGQVEGFVAVQTDITALKESHQREILQRATAIDASTDGVAISNRDGQYVYMNRSHRQMFGISETEDVRNLGWTDLTTPAGLERFMRADMPKLQAERRWRGEMRGLHRSGAILDLEVTLTLTDDDDLVCIARDVTERNKFEADRVRLREELQLAQKREAVSQVASGVAHDLNNLVAVVLGTVSLLQMNARGDSELTVSLRRIGRAMDAAQDLVDRLGSLERPDVPRGQHDLRTLVIEAIDLLGAERVRRHMVHAELPNGNQTVWANRTELVASDCQPCA